MQYTQAERGRIFVIRLEDGEILHKEIENFAKKHSIQAASVIAVGGADKGSRIVVGPEKARTYPIVPMEYVLENVSEITGTGTIFPDQDGEPILHMHLSFGHKDHTITGCVRQGVKVWHVMEVVIQEFMCNSKRVMDPQTGFKLLNP